MLLSVFENLNYKNKMSLSNLDIDKIIEAIDIGDLSLLIDELSYDGFDPLALLGHVWNKHKAHVTDFKVHLGVMITVGVHRGFGGGKTIEKIAGKTSTSGGTKIKAAANFLEIKMKATGKLDLTIGRLMVIFPILTHKIWMMKTSNRIMNDHGLPLMFMYPGSPSMMSSEQWDSYGKAYCEWMLEVQASLWGTPGDIETVQKYANLSYNNPCCPMARRTA
jgi:hypothetical protein